MSMAGTMGSGVATFQGTPLVLGQCAPDAGVLTGIHGPTQTAVNDFAASTDRLGLFDLEEGGAGTLGTTPLFRLSGWPAMDEAEALKFYSAAAETIDGDGPYPPNDKGSSGLSGAQAAAQAGFAGGYQHFFSLADALTALQTAWRATSGRRTEPPRGRGMCASTRSHP
jgi:hypothetical protein